MLRQLLTEAVVLAALGGVAGVLIAWWGTAVLAANGPDAIPRLDEVAVDGRVLIYALTISIATGVLFEMAPARMLLQQNNTFGTGQRTVSPAGWRYRAALVTFNVALSAVLLVGSGLLVRSFLHLLTVEPGFNPHSVLTMQMGLSGQSYADSAGITRFYDELTARPRALPGVAAVSASTQLPLTGNIDRSGITIESRPLDNPAAAPEGSRVSARRRHALLPHAREMRHDAQQTLDDHQLAAMMHLVLLDAEQHLETRLGRGLDRRREADGLEELLARQRFQQVRELLAVLAERVDDLRFRLQLLLDLGGLRHDRAEILEGDERLPVVLVDLMRPPR
jgi:hypothetical protein